MIQDRYSREDYDPKKEYDTDYDRCDLCDKLRFPQVGWCCEHDDPAHGTSICIVCLKEIYERECK